MVQVSNTYKGPHLPTELWREIVFYLSRRDLHNLVSVPHVLSSIARQFLFRDLTLHLGTGAWDEDQGKVPFGPNEIDKWHARRSAEILCRLSSDATYARQVRSLTIWAPQRSEAGRLLHFLCSPVEHPPCVSVAGADQRVVCDALSKGCTSRTPGAVTRLKR
jgi:hypothetical protein